MSVLIEPEDELLRQCLAEGYDQAPCGLLVARLDGLILHVNQTVLDLTDYTREELVSTRRLLDLLPIAGKLFYENQYAPLVRLQGRVTGVAFDLVRRDGGRLPVLMSSVLRPNAAGAPALIASALMDATDRRAYERELLLARRASDQLAAVVSASSDAIVSLSPDGLVQTWNAGAERLFGYAAPEMAGRSLRALLAPEEGESGWRQLAADLHSGEVVHRELIGCSADGRRIDLAIRLTPHPGLLGEAAIVSAIIQDISDRRSLERLQQDYLAMAAHELRSPITGIKAHAQLMRRHARYRAQSVDAIIQQTNQLNDLVGDLLLTSQIEADQLDLRLERLDLIEMTRAAVDQLGAPAAVDAPARPLDVLADKRRLGQVLTNVLTNALKYSPAGSAIEVRVAREGDEAQVVVTDHGVGIAPEALPHLFERFYRAPETAATTIGAGLGLYISQRIVTAHGGRLAAASALGRGSVFTIALPLLHSEDPMRPPTDDEAFTSSQG